MNIHNPMALLGMCFMLGCSIFHTAYTLTHHRKLRTARTLIFPFVLVVITFILGSVAFEGKASLFYDNPPSLPVIWGFMIVLAFITLWKALEWSRERGK